MLRAVQRRAQAVRASVTGHEHRASTLASSGAPPYVAGQITPARALGKEAARISTRRLETRVAGIIVSAAASERS